MYICLAPMDGITDAVYRYLTHTLVSRHNPDHSYQCWTEFMSSEGYMHNRKRLVRHLVTYHQEYPYTIAQIYGGRGENLLQVAQEIDQKYHFAGIELNIGCPSPKVMACGGGAGMLKDKTHTLSIIKQISSQIQTPFSIKTRIGLSTEDRQSQKDFILASAEYCHMITIHGRTYRQSHSGTVDWGFISDIKSCLGDRVKIIGNGGIKSYTDLLEHAADLDGIMIGQAAIGNPWILTPVSPSIEMRYEMIMTHLRLSCLMELYIHDQDHYDDIRQTFIQPDLVTMLAHIGSIDTHPERNTCHAVIEFRKYLFNYIQSLPHNRDFKIKVAHTKDYDTLKYLIQEYMDQVQSGV